MREFAEMFIAIAPYIMMLMLYWTVMRRIDRLWEVIELMATALKTIDTELDDIQEELRST